ncbi:MAG: addiction module protein [Sulfuricellaceae bacterium]
MSTQELVSEALRLKAEERLAIVDALLRSLDQPDPEIDRFWADEAERRLMAYRAGKVKGIPAEEVLGGNNCVSPQSRPCLFAPIL